MKKIVCGDEAYAPSKIICVGRNFHQHAREMGDAGVSAVPIVFFKPNSSISFDPKEVDIPDAFGLLHHEVELSALLVRGGRDFSEEEAQSVIGGYAVGIDLTLRDLQNEAKRGGRPWALAKGFDASAVFGRFLTADEAGDMRDRSLSLSVNGERRQSGRTSLMEFTPARIVAFVSRFITIDDGDVLMCGTPAGVGEILEGDRVFAQVEGLPELDFVVHRN